MMQLLIVDRMREEPGKLIEEEGQDGGTIQDQDLVIQVQALLAHHLLGEDHQDLDADMTYHLPQ